MRLLADENLVGLDAVAPLCELRTKAGREIATNDLQDVDVLWVRSVTRVDAALLRGTPVRAVGTATAGVEHVDREWLASQGIAFHHAPGANANAVAEYVLGALASLQAPWERLDSGGVLGVVGYGAVGRQLCDVATALGWQVRVSDPWVADRAGESSAIRFSALEDVLRSDVITLHCELTDARPWPSRQLIGRAELSALGAEQYLVNASRGEVIDGGALLGRLQQPQPPQLVLDVWEREPRIDPALVAAPTLRLATPHIAGYSWDAKWAATRMLAVAQWGEQGAVLQPPLGTPPSLEATDSDGADLLRQLLLARYDPAVDDAALREALRSPDAVARGAAFDALRRDYRVRRELRGSTVRSGRALNAHALRGLTALGVNTTYDQSRR